MDVIDEVGDPGACTWHRYNGPLMIDLTVPFDVEVPTDVTGLVRANAVNFRRPPTLDAEPLEVREPGDCDTIWEMKEAICQGSLGSCEAMCG